MISWYKILILYRFTHHPRDNMYLSVYKKLYSEGWSPFENDKLVLKQGMTLVIYKFTQKLYNGPIDGYQSHCSSDDQSEASSQVTWLVLTNQWPVFRSCDKYWPIRGLSRVAGRKYLTWWRAPRPENAQNNPELAPDFAKLVYFDKTKGPTFEVLLKQIWERRENQTRVVSKSKYQIKVAFSTKSKS